VETAAVTTARPAREPSPRAGTALPIGSLGFFLITLDILIVNVALARIGQDLGGGTAGKQRVIDGYTLMFASLLLPIAVFGALINRPATFVAVMQISLLVTATLLIATALVSLRIRMHPGGLTAARATGQS
jgi:DHA2 family methylenomycin A resistance protein-like MFS transporter